MKVTNMVGSTEQLSKYLKSPVGSIPPANMVKMDGDSFTESDVNVLCGAGCGERLVLRGKGGSSRRKG